MEWRPRGASFRGQKKWNLVGLSVLLILCEKHRTLPDFIPWFLVLNACESIMHWRFMVQHCIDGVHQTNTNLHLHCNFTNCNVTIFSYEIIGSCLILQILYNFFSFNFNCFLYKLFLEGQNTLNDGWRVSFHKAQKQWTSLNEGRDWLFWEWSLQ
jgi:hypothetical protein